MTATRPSPGSRRRVAEPTDAVARPPSPAFRVGWLAVVVFTVGLHAYTLASWSWYQDDLLFTSQTPDQGLGEFMFRPIADHWAPGTLGLIWVVTTLAR